MALWFLVSALLLATLIVPYWWFWDKISATTDKLALISGFLAWALWKWWKFASVALRQIGSRA